MLTRATLPALLGLAEPWYLTGLDYLFTSAGLLQVAKPDTLIHLPQPDLDWPVVDHFLTALMPALDPDHADHAAAHAAVRVLAQAGFLQAAEPAHLFEIDGAWPDLLPLLLDDDRWQQLFTHLHGAEALVSYCERVHVWVTEARQERARWDQAQAELAAYLLAAERGQEPDAGPGSSDPPSDGGDGTPNSGPGGSERDAPAAVAAGLPFPTVAGDPDPGATRDPLSLADHQGVAAGSSRHLRGRDRQRHVSGVPQAALALVPPPIDGRDWPAFLHVYRLIGRVDGLRDVRPADHTTLQALFAVQPDRCWQVLARWAAVPPMRISPAILRRALTVGREA